MCYLFRKTIDFLPNKVIHPPHRAPEPCPVVEPPETEGLCVYHPERIPFRVIQTLHPAVLLAEVARQHYLIQQHTPVLRVRTPWHIDHANAEHLM